jgi:type IV pilus assembly protein PilC
LHESIRKAREELNEGAGIPESLESTRLIPPIAVKMAHIGEQTGSLSESMHKASEFYAQKTRETIASLLRLMEPFLIVSIGIIVLVVVFAMYLPIFSMGNF